MVTLRGKMLDPWHVRLDEPIPAGEDRIEIRLDQEPSQADSDAQLLVRNPSFDFLRDEPDLYAD